MCYLFQFNGCVHLSAHGSLQTTEVLGQVIVQSGVFGVALQKLSFDQTFDALFNELQIQDKETNKHYEINTQ